MLKHNSIKVHQKLITPYEFLSSFKLDHTDSSLYRNENQLVVWVILKIFEWFRLKHTIDRPEYWLSTICLEKLWNIAFCPRSVW